MYKNTANLALLYSSLTLTGSMFAGNALAQEAPEKLMLEEVVVTATKVAESIQDIPSTITAVGGEALDEFQIRDFSDVTSLAPGLSLDSVNPTNPTVALRGVSFNPESNGRASVETYWNEMPIATQAIFQQMFDLSRIEVLRGPQGTLQGRTSPAGAILVNTRLPSFDEFEANIQQTVAENSAYNTQVGVGIPISDSLAVRIAGVHDSNELEGIERVGIENVRGDVQQTGHTNAGRLSVVWEPTDSFSATLISEYLESYKDGFEDVVNVTGGFPQTFDRVAIHDGLMAIEQRNKLNVLRMRLDLPGHELTWVTGYRELNNYAERDRDPQEDNPVFRQPGEEVRQAVDTNRASLMQELRLGSVDTEFWEYLVGVYYEDQDITTDVEISIHRPNSPPFIIPQPDIITQITSDTEQFGVFAHNRFHFGESTTLQAGVRWSKYNLTPVATLSGPQGDESLDAITGGIKLSQYFGENMLYAAYDISYRPSNGLVSLDQQQFRSFDEEDSTSFELGIKTTLWDGRAQINGAVYYQQFDNYIARATGLLYDADGDGFAEAPVAGGVTFNGDAIVQGAEMDFNVLLSENWNMSGGASYNDATFDSGAMSPCVLPDRSVPVGAQLAQCSVEDQRVGGEPNWSVSLNSEYSVPLGFGDWYVRGLYKFNDHRGGTNTPDVPGYSTTNLYTGLRAESGWEVSFWVKNAFDKEAEVQPQALLPGDTFNSVAIIPERTFGITGTYNFYR